MIDICKNITPRTRIAGLFVLAALCGCGRGDEFNRSRVSGKVTLDGKVIPYGEVLLTPDTAKGNSGPSVVAPIGPDGIYQTSSGKGAIAGPAIAKIVGYADTPGSVSDGGSPALLLDNVAIEVDIPKGKGTIDFPLTSQQVRQKK